MNIVGKFKIIDYFTAKDHKGVVLVGNLVEGQVAIGNYIVFTSETGEVLLKIISQEKIQTISGVHYTGLLLEHSNNFELVKRQEEVTIREANK